MIDPKFRTIVIIPFLTVALFASVSFGADAGDAVADSETKIFTSKSLLEVVKLADILL